MRAGLVLPFVKPERKLRLFMTADAVGGVWQYALDLARGLVEHHVATTLAVLGPSPRPGQVEEAGAVPGLTLLPIELPLDWTAATPDEVTSAGSDLAAWTVNTPADLRRLLALQPPLRALISDRPDLALAEREGGGQAAEGRS